MPSVRQRFKAQRPSEGHARTIVEGGWAMCEFTGKCANIIHSWNPAVLGFLIVCPMMRRLWFGVDDGLLRPLHLERGMAMEPSDDIFHFAHYNSLKFFIYHLVKTFLTRECLPNYTS